MSITIRSATPQDVPQILAFIRELADYERLLHVVVASEETLRENLFGAKPRAGVVFAMHEGREVGFALFFHNFSTFTGQPGLYLEDLFVKPEARGLGVGKKLMAWLAKTAVERNCARFEWAVLDWNEPAIKFYRSIGAKGLDDWRVQRVDGEALRALAASSD
jgi:GNAT superfamily N-acetyltransferase